MDWAEKDVVQMESMMCTKKCPGKKPMDASIHWSEGLISVVRREHGIEIEQLLKHVLVLQIAGVLTHVYHHRVIGVGRVSKTDLRWSRRQNLATTLQVRQVELRSCRIRRRLRFGCGQGSSH